MLKIKGKSCVLLIALFAFVACGSSDKTGSISGRVIYGSLDEEKPNEPVKNVRIVLCRVDRGLPKGPVVADMNEGHFERIGVIKAKPTAVTDAEGNFVLNEVPEGSYLVLMHLMPNALEALGAEWDGIVLTEADVDDAFKQIPSSGKIDFWVVGGLISGRGDWNSKDGFIFKNGMAGSKKWGLFFSVRDQRPHPIVEVRPDSNIEIVLRTHIMPGSIN